MTAVEFLLNKYRPFDDLERKDIERLRQFAATAGDKIYDYKPDNPCITASSVVVNPSFTNILLMHHRDHDFFKQFGGHAEGNRNLPTVAKKELFQESGGIRAEPVFPNPFDLIVWRMPARLRRTDGLFYPEHDVYDIAFLFIVPDAVKFDVNRNEGFAIKWLSLTEFRDMKFNPDNPTFKNNPQNVQYNERIYEKLMILKKKLKNL